MSVKYTFLGHATHFLEVDGHTILIDPFLTDNPMTTVSAEVIDPDFILVSHGHGDHIADAAPIAKRTGAKTHAQCLKTKPPTQSQLFELP